MAKDILKEAIADAKAVREVALANAKAALEEAFTPKLQSMLSAKLSEDLDEAEEMEEMGYGMEEADMDEADMDEMNYGMEEADMDEITGMENEAEDMEENLDEEIDLEEILNELELEEGEEANEEKVEEAKDEDLEEAKKADDKDLEEAKDDMEEEKLDEMGRPIYKAEDANYAGYTADRIHEGEEFDLDALLEEINNLDEEKEDTNEGEVDELSTLQKIGSAAAQAISGKKGGGMFSSPLQPRKGESMADYEARVGDDPRAAKLLAAYKANPDRFEKVKAMMEDESMQEDMFEALEKELEETKAALEVKTTELNEVNLLNSKLLYVNRIFKANTLDEGQKLRVVETLDKAETAKEAKLIYETIKDTFNVAKSKKASFKNKTKSLKEGIGMASKAAGTSTAPKKEVIAESDNLVNRFQKLANIKINH